tara:strand:+ start:271 stop:534 length:264 start_codon:yes stop_codon:yes gene_type:complete
LYICVYQCFKKEAMAELPNAIENETFDEFRKQEKIKGYLPKINHWCQELQREVTRNYPDKRWISHCVDKLNYFTSRHEHRNSKYSGY